MDRGTLAADYRRIRGATARLCAPLEREDYVVQPVDDVSPPKWHLAHTTWFFEQFLLAPYEPAYRPHDARYAGLFNSYYRTIGDPYPRARRGTLSRPTVAEVYAYRDAVDERLLALLGAVRPEEDAFARALVLGLQHEQQHQELLVCDIKLILAHNAVPARYDAEGAGFSRPREPRPASRRAGWVSFPGGRLTLGHEGAAFAFDNEGPAHDVLVRPFRLRDRLVTNGEFARFVRDGGYSDFRHWVSDGFDRVRVEGWRAPLYWTPEGGLAAPHGVEELDRRSPSAT